MSAESSETPKKKRVKIINSPWDSVKHKNLILSSNSSNEFENILDTNIHAWNVNTDSKRRNVYTNPKLVTPGQKSGKAHDWRTVKPWIKNGIKNMR